VARAVQGADVVVNLVGVFGSSDAMYAVNADGAENVAKAAVNAGIQTLVHMSAIGADAASPSAYGRSRAGGESAVRKVFPDAIILRPSIIFGREDQFVNRFAAMIAIMPVVPVIGANTRFQPVFVGDVAQAVVNSLQSGGVLAGKTLELGGPEVLSMLDLNKRIAVLAGRSRTFLPVPHLAAAALALVPGGPISGDQLKMLGRDNVVGEGALGLTALGIAQTPLASVAHGWMDRYRLHGRFGARAKA
jgi:NADH dehydrogenase